MYTVDFPFRPSSHEAYSAPSGAAYSAWKLCEPKVESSFTVTGALQ